ncbi:hypothetical protein ACG33_14580 [Steroidobacter denitrificans]|uniref:Uncharacterized protein n=1 Tax=Steroidobacter denitrificans TaxID=465721 RepID=A0A127FD29_STEDE|nr:hypothetical protein ACG33_14580 [Steroidobacter denitrificans]
MFGFQLIIERLRIVVIDEHERITRLQVIDEFEYFRMSLYRDKAANIYFLLLVGRGLRGRHH